MSEFKKLVLKRFPAVGEPESAESHYWKKFENPITIKEYGSVSYVHFSPVKPYDVAVTSGSRVQIYSPLNGQVKKTISKFKEAAFCGSFRDDGQLMVVGDGNGSVKVFELGGRVLLRQFKGHTRSTHVSCFSIARQHVFSASDDQTVRYWDLATETAICVLEGHEDHIRTGTTIQTTPDLFLTGSYDHTLRLWDVRTQSCVMKADHGSPIESTLMFPSGSSCISSGSNDIKVWDVLQGGRILAAVSNHQKTITCLAFNSNYRRLLSGSLDRQVKVYNTQDYTVVYSSSYPASILSLGLSPNEESLIVGMTGGYISMRSRRSGDQDKPIVPRLPPTPGTFRYYHRGTSAQPDQDDVIVERIKHRGLAEYETFLRKFQYRNALDAALKTGRHVVIVSLVQELVHRDGLKIALSGRDEMALEPVLRFLTKYIADPRYTALLSDVCNIVLDIYAGAVGESPKIDELLQKLKSRIDYELIFQQQVFQLLGAMDMIFAASLPRPTIPSETRTSTD
ncbi:U3 small nucleolar RNA-associated protein 15 homolog [Corticium candelabrum]|uniref:U3 small nucleolar RNA-associated protein 15 homolog n=1 Tax=Corticium candelabrum TaxID=121492 RepID=UPI002E25FE51|nr:U3 small nucleolar RNA-associated protein 15 homolog [Corticium candelabrum]